jgi:hypothetical protein
MSRLRDRLRKASRVQPAPIGFAAATSRGTDPTMLCLVRLSGGEIRKAGEAVERGADGVIMEGGDAGKLKDLQGQGLAGVLMQKATRQSVAAAREAGADFVVLDLESAMAEALLEEQAGLVIALREAPDDTTLRLLGDLGLEALIVPSPGESLSVRELLELRRTSALARTPMLTAVRVDIDGSTLQALRESGMAGVIVDAAAMGELSALRERILGLPPRGRKREERGEALLPAGVTVGGGEGEDDEDEDRARARR